MEKDKKIEGQEDFILKKIRHYQGTIKDFDTFWQVRTAQGAKETSAETKAVQSHNADLNKAFEIVPVTPDDDTPKPITPVEVKAEEEKEDKKECDCKDKDCDCKKGDKECNCKDKDCDDKECDCKKDDKDDDKKKKKVNEGLVASIKISSATTKVQGACQDLIDKLLEDEPEKYKSGEDIMKAIKDKAIKGYQEAVEKKFDDAIEADEWWEKYSKANAHLLDITLFGKE